LFWRRYGGTFTDGANSAEPVETTMLRKLSLVAVAAASLGAAALAPTSASAWGGLLWFWFRRLLCAAIGPNAVGTSLAPRQSLLLSLI